MPELFLAVALLLQAPPAQDPKSEITEKEAIEFARGIELQVQKGDSYAIDKLFDYGAHVDAAFKGLRLKKALVDRFKDSKGQARIDPAFLSADGGSYSFLRFRTVERIPRILFRGLARTMLGYQELFLHRRSDGAIRVVDVMHHHIGECMSALTRRGALGVASVDMDAFETLEGRELLIAENIVRILEIGMESLQGDAKRALAIYAMLPDPLKREPILQSYRLSAAIRLGEEECDRVQKELERDQPKWESPPLMDLQSCLLRKRHEAALKAIDRLDRSLGGDPYLNCLRADVHLARQKPQEAKDCAKKAAEDFPRLFQARWLPVRVSLAERAYSETATLLCGIERDFESEFSLGGCIVLEEFKDFLKSPEYRDWVKSRSPK